MKKEEFISIIKNIQEPSLKKNLVDLNFIKNIDIDENTISFDLYLKNLAHHNKLKVKDEIINVLTEKNKTHQLKINYLPIESKQNDTSLSKVKNIIAVASGKGGVGKSTVSANLAVALSELGYKTGVVDADIYGPSMPSIFNVEYEKPTIVETDLGKKMHPITSYNIKLMSIGFFSDINQAAVWRGPMATKALNQLLYDTHWEDLDYLVIDLPPGTGDIHLSMVQQVPLTGVIIISTPQKIALIDAIKAINMFKLPQINVPILGLIENMSYFTPEELPNNKYYIFGNEGVKKLSEENNLNILAEIPLIQSIRESVDYGHPFVMKNNKQADIFNQLAKSLNDIILERTSKGLKKATPVKITNNNSSACSK